MLILSRHYIQASDYSTFAYCRCSVFQDITSYCAAITVRKDWSTTKTRASRKVLVVFTPEKFLTRFCRFILLMLCILAYSFTSYRHVCLSSYRLFYMPCCGIVCFLQCCVCALPQSCAAAATAAWRQRAPATVQTRTSSSSTVFPHQQQWPTTTADVSCSSCRYCSLVKRWIATSVLQASILIMLWYLNSASRDFAVGLFESQQSNDCAYDAFLRIHLPELSQLT